MRLSEIQEIFTGKFNKKIVAQNGLAIDQGSVNYQTGTSYTVQATDNGKIIALLNAAAITLTFPSGLGAQFTCSIIQQGAGQVTITAGSSVTLRSRNGAVKTAGQYAIASIVCLVANEPIIGGDVTV